MVERKKTNILNTVILIVFGVIVALAGVYLYQHLTTEESTSASQVSSTAPPPTFSSSPLTPLAGTSAPTGSLSPETVAAIQTFMCPCGCGNPLEECECKQPGGSTEARAQVQQLLDEGKTIEEIADVMVNTYGDAVLK